MNINRLRLAVAALNGQPVSVQAFFSGQEVEAFAADPGVEADEVLVFVQPQLSYTERVRAKTEPEAKPKGKPKA